ncbi:MAG TPA: hypothetical protein DCO72_02620 [Ruminococcus sp.]|nr:hypothetical protein [Ruminococcus sp.]
MDETIDVHEAPVHDEPQQTDDVFNAKKASQKRKKSSRKNFSSSKKFSMPQFNKSTLVVLIAILVLVGVIAGLIIYGNWRNNGAKFALKLSQQIGEQQATAEKSAHLKLGGSSEFSCINQIAMEQGGLLFESQKATTVSGVKIPEWVIFAREENGDILSEITFYHYKQLGEFGNGVKVKAHVAAEGITTIMTPEAVQHYVGFAPLRVNYNADGMQEAYKYYYRDLNSGDSVSYILYVNYENGFAVSAAEEENLFILPFLTLR